MSGDNRKDRLRFGVTRNAGRIEQAEARGTLPYFVRDNRSFVDRILNPQPERLSIYGSLGSLTGTKLGREATKEAYKIYENAQPTTLSEIQQKNVVERGKLMGVKGQIKPMSFLEADSGNANLHYAEAEAFKRKR